MNPKTTILYWYHSCKWDYTAERKKRYGEKIRV
jgi:hypothetical protein